MWNQTKAASTLGVEYPILQGPFGGGLSSVKLTATVSNNGGLGGFGAYTMSATDIHKTITELNAATNKPYNINLWIADGDPGSETLSDEQFEQTAQWFKPYFDELGIPLPSKPASFESRFENQFQAIIDTKPKVFSFMFGTLPIDKLELCRKLGIVTIGAATTVDEAVALDNTGVDLVIASGFEAGGHRPSFLDTAERSTMGTFVLLQLLKEKIRTPVIAAGGIATGRGIAAAMTLGAEAVQVGTAFLACDESNAPPQHKQMLFSDAGKYTTLTRAFTGRLGRGLVNRVNTEWPASGKHHLPFPLQGTFLSSLRKAAIEQEKWDMVFLWGGQIAPILKHTSAEKLMHSLVKETATFF